MPSIASATRDTSLELNGLHFALPVVAATRGVGLRWWFVQCSNRYDAARLVPREGRAA